MAGSIDMVTRCYTGLELHGGMLWLHPALPPEVSHIDFTLYFQQQLIRVTVDSAVLRPSVYPGGAAPITAMVEGKRALLSPGETREFAYNGQWHEKVLSLQNDRLHVRNHGTRDEW